jgi:hypothetical protein
MLHLTGAVIVKALFGTTLSDLDGALLDDFRVVTEYSLRRILTLTAWSARMPTAKLRQYRRAQRRLEETVWHIIDTRRRHGGSPARTEHPHRFCGPRSVCLRRQVWRHQLLAFNALLLTRAIPPFATFPHRSSDTYDGKSMSGRAVAICTAWSEASMTACMGRPQGSVLIDVALAHGLICTDACR